MPAEEFRIGDYWLTKHRSSPNWQRTFYDKPSKQTKRVSLGTEDFQQAVERLTDWYFKTHRLVNADPKDIPLSAVLLRYYEDYAINIPSHAQQKIYCRLLNEFFGEAMVSEVTIRRQEEYIEQRRQLGRADSTISRELSALGAAFARAKRGGEIVNVPHVINAGSGHSRERRLSLTEMAALFNAAKSDHFVMFLMLAANTLARPEAILQLKPFQVDLENRLIHLNPPNRKQTKKRRPDVPITSTLLPWVTGITTNHLVSYGARGVKSIKKAFRLARDAAGLGSDVIPYTIRHTMATELRKRGVPAWEVSGMLGHKTGGTSEIYAKYDPNYLSLAAKAIDAYFAELQPLVTRSLVGPKLAASRVSLV